jgi:two-component system LytT family sensor kinase
MPLFRNYIFPILFGLLIYTSVRLVTDSMSHEQFWDRSLRQNLIEIFSVIILSFVFELLLRGAIRRFNRRKRELSIRNILKEFGKICMAALVIFNPALYLIHYFIHDPVDWADIIIGNMLVVLYIMLYYAIARGNTLLRSYIEQQMQIEKIRNEQLQTELKFLKAQYHPHFLFNALNTIYFQMDENVSNAKQTVERFSELLRYQLYDHHQKVFVQQELDYLNNFIYLQKARSSDKLKLTMQIDNNIGEVKIYPLIFLPLVENAFKYVGGDYRICIQVKREQEYIFLIVRNSVLASETKPAGGIGLENLNRRLELVYPGNHNLTTEKTESYFESILKIPTHEDQLHNYG